MNAQKRKDDGGRRGGAGGGKGGSPVGPPKTKGKKSAPPVDLEVERLWSTV